MDFETHEGERKETPDGVSYKKNDEERQNEAQSLFDQFFEKNLDDIRFASRMRIKTTQHFMMDLSTIMTDKDPHGNDGTYMKARITTRNIKFDDDYYVDGQSLWLGFPFKTFLSMLRAKGIQDYHIKNKILELKFRRENKQKYTLLYCSVVELIDEDNNEYQLIKEYYNKKHKRIKVEK